MDPVQILSGLGSLALIVGIGIGLVQLRGLRTQRQEELVIRAYAPMLDPTLIQAYWRIHAWDFPDYAAFQVRATVADWTDLDHVASYFEMMGILYKRGLAKLDILDDLFAGSLLITWRKIAPFVRGYRIQGNVPDYAQWFEHLAGALDQRLTRLGEAHPDIDEPAPPPSSTLPPT